MIVEDSPVQRMLLELVIGEDPRFRVVASVDSGEAALRALARAAPDVITMDIRLPGIDGFETTRRIMRERPTPIVVISNSIRSEELDIAMNALRAGALSIIEKPKTTARDEYQRAGAHICRQLAAMSQVKVVRQRGSRGRVYPVAGAAPAGKRVASGGLKGIRLVGIAASTGGPAALVRLLNDAGPGFPLPVALVQHIAPSFLEGFADWLSKNTPFKTRLVESEALPGPATVFLPRPGRHLVYEGGRLQAVKAPAVGGHMPSASVLFRSMAESLGSRAIGIVLTGMGDDGADGCLVLRQAGGYTISEHASTAVVDGMPAAAAALGGVIERLPVGAIAARMWDLIDTGGRADRREEARQ